MDIQLILDKIKSLLINNSDINEHEYVENEMQKAFNNTLNNNSAINQVIIKILGLSENFPKDILLSTEGHKYNELEFFEANLDSNVDSNQYSFFDYFKQTQTKLGTILLKKYLLNPTINTTQLISRQNIIKKFLNTSPDEYKQLLKDIESLIEIENDILICHLPETPEMTEIYNTIFFQLGPLKMLNHNESFLKLFYYFIIIFSPIYGIVAPFVMFIAPFLFLKYALGVPVTLNTFWTIFKNMFIGGSGGGGFLSTISKLINMLFLNQSTNSDNSNPFSVKSVILWLIKNILAIVNSSAGSWIYLGFIFGMYLYGIYNSFQISLTYHKIINQFHNRLNKISKWIKQIFTIYDKYGCFTDIDPSFTSLDLRIKNIRKQKIIKYLLEKETFDSEPGIFTNKGIIIKTYKIFLELKENQEELLEPLCEYLAHVDMWSSLANWLQITPSKSNFSTYITEKDFPCVEGSNIWNICCQTPVTNDVTLGKSTNSLNNNLIITGANGSGKSTYIKSVIECIILAQTIGVVPAEEFKFTPFSSIGTYLNIPDCQGKESLFQAEMNRCYNQLEKLSKCEEKGEFTFNIMDEIFVSTNYFEGMSGAYAIINKMCKLDKSINIITTHFDVLANMDNLNVDKKYFDIEFNDEDDTIIKDYKIKSGVSHKHLALKLLKKKGFDPDIISDAEFLYQKLTNNSSNNSSSDSNNIIPVEKEESSEVEFGEVESREIESSEIESGEVESREIESSEVESSNKEIIETKEKIVEDNNVENKE